MECPRLPVLARRVPVVSIAVRDLWDVPPAIGVEPSRRAWPSTRDLLLAGTGLNVIAYASMEPVAVAAVFGLVGLVLVGHTRMGGVHEMRMYRMMFAVGWLMAGVAAVYANYWNDPGQNLSDAASFYELASGGSGDLSLEDMRVLTEGAGAVMLWSSVYDAFASAGFAKGRYVGILINVFAVALAGVIAIKTAKCIVGEDAPRLNRLILLFSLCGIFWLFAAIHLRDGVVLLSVTLLVYCWARYLAHPRWFDLVLLVSASALGVVGFAFLRAEFAMVPFAMAMAGVTAGLLFNSARGSTRLGMWTLALVCLVGGMVVAIDADVLGSLERSRENYKQLAAQSASSESLGNRYVTNAPLPVRLVVGSIYLFLFPIPFWSGFGGASAYHLFKSCNVLFFYAVTPLVALTGFRLYELDAVKLRGVMFLFFVVIGFTVGVAATSLETRHFGAFVAPLLVLATVPDLRLKRDWRAYTTLLSVVVAVMASIHTAWAVLKLLR